MGRGSVGDVTFSRMGGQQVGRARNRKPNNPRTQKQMSQRAIFMSAVKFYSRGVQRFFKFAFEGKRAAESDYNAFMRINAKRGIYFRKADFENPLCPAIGKFTVTQGSLVSPNYTCEAGSNAVTVVSTFTTQSAAPTTVGGLSAVLKSQYGLLEGDIVTFLVLTSGATLNQTGDYVERGLILDDGAPVVWHLQQFVIDSNSTVALSTLSVTATTSSFTFSAPGTATNAGGAAIVFSRNSASGLRVSTSEIALNSAAEDIYDEGRIDSADPEWKETVMQSWMAADTAILEGGLASNG